MKTPLKVIAIVAVLIAVALAGALAYVVLAVDLNSYKPQLERAARSEGIELDISGELSWSLWPNLAITFGKTQFAGPDHGIQPSSLQRAHLAVSWRELLRKRIAIKALLVDGAKLHLSRLEGGGFLIAAPATGEQPVETTTSDGQHFSLAIAQLTVANSQLRLDQGDDTLLLDEIAIDTGNVNVNDQPFPLSLSFRFHPNDGEPITLSARHKLRFDKSKNVLTVDDGTLTTAGLLSDTLRLSLSAAANLNNSTVTVDHLNIALGSTHLSGSATAGFGEPRFVNLQLAGGDIDVDSLLGSQTAPPAGSDKAASKDATTATEPAHLLAPLVAPLALLDGGKGHIVLSLDSLLFDGLTFTAPRLELHAAGKTITIDTLSAGLFAGSLHSEGKVTLNRVPEVQFSAQLDSIDLAAALDYVAEDATVSGTLTLAVDGHSRGEDSDALLNNLAASGKLQLIAPQLGHVNIEQSYCELAALIERSGNRQQPWPKGTLLNDLTSDFHIAGQLLHLDRYSTGLGNLSLHGDGTINIDQQSFNIRAITRLNGERTSATGCEVKSARVRDKDIPFICKDRFADAGASSCKPDPNFVRSVLQKEVFSRLLGGDDSGDNNDKNNVDENEDEGRDRTKNTAKALEKQLRGLFGR